MSTPTIIPIMHTGCAKPATVTITGRITRDDDPMYRADKDRIYKSLPTDDIPATVTRWLALGRVITGITS